MKKTALQRFGANLKRLRLARGLTQELLAERSDSHPNYIGDLERGERNPSLTKILLIAHALGCHVADLFEGLATTGTSRR